MSPGGHVRPADRAGPRRWLLLPAGVLVLSGLMAAGCSSSTLQSAVSGNCS